MSAYAAKLYLAILLIGAGILAGCYKPHEADTDGKITGLVTRDGRGVGMAVIEVYLKAEQNKGTPPYAETITNEDGSFELTVTPGRYWIWAKASIDEGGREKRLVGKGSPAPVDLGSGGDAKVRVELSDPSGFTPGSGPSDTGVTGRVSPSGEGVNVYAYRGKLDKPTGPDFVAVARLGEDGSFKLNLSPGGYTVTARKRGTGDNFGPVGVSDVVAVRIVEVMDGEFDDLGTLELGGIDPDLWGSRTKTPGSGDMLLEGKVVDAEGNPVAKVRVLGFTDPRMTGKPASLSGATTADGVFFIRLQEGKRYYLGGRSRLGGPAEPGELTGQYMGEGGDGVTLNPGVKHPPVTIKVEEIW